jgi:oligoendopeptidase F
MKLETVAFKEITNNVTVAGNITLENGEEYAINSQSYYTLLSTDRNRNNRKKGFEKRFYHLINESDRMAKLYFQKAKLDDLYARELNYSDYYEGKMFDSYLTKEQIQDMNSVFNEIFIKTITGNYMDVYPAPENGKQPGGYAISLCALKSPSIIFMNYDGLINDKKTITHELGHDINF